LDAGTVNGCAVNSWPPRSALGFNFVAMFVA
jgi:hypothetical protein